ncbi:hypothetical protein, partial [Roseibium sp. RKSG952]|uniref:hypothetical protein n=1 Tax=Roseibium sp. RKSG952 TaxID=2529384 RepID=UPI001AD930F2
RPCCTSRLNSPRQKKLSDYVGVMGRLIFLYVILSLDDKIIIVKPRYWDVVSTAEQNQATGRRKSRPLAAQA